MVPEENILQAIQFNSMELFSLPLETQDYSFNSLLALMSRKNGTHIAEKMPEFFGVFFQTNLVYLFIAIHIVMC